MNSNCGFSCGFIMEKQQAINPLDYTLVLASSYFPFDYLLYAIIVIDVFISSIYGIIKLVPKLKFLKVFIISYNPF